MFGLGQKVLSHLAWSKFWPILANQETLAILHENEAKKIFFFRKKNFKMANWKKAYFPKSPILKKFSRKFHGLVLGLVGLNDAKPIDLAQPIWRWGCLKKALKQAKNVFFVFLGPFRAYVGQPQGHIGEPYQWASHHLILLTQRPIHEIFAKKFWELTILENKHFFSRPFRKQKQTLLHSHVKWPKILG